MWITEASLWFTLLFTISAGQEQQPQVRMQCGSSAAVEWTSVPRTKIGSSQLRHAGTVAFDIPSVIPSSAKEVLVLADMQTGYSGPNDVISYVKIYTQRSSRNLKSTLCWGPTIRAHGASTQTIFGFQWLPVARCMLNLHKLTHRTWSWTLMLLAIADCIKKTLCNDIGHNM